MTEAFIKEPIAAQPKKLTLLPPLLKLLIDKHEPILQ
jgi:hypothetical protein